jgi:AbrB family looped-hinge helix DNA binding protein
MSKPTYASRFTRVGTSKAIILPKEVRELMGLIPGDLVVMRLFGKLLICRRLDPKDVVDVNAIPADALPSAVRS